MLRHSNWLLKIKAFTALLSTLKRFNYFNGLIKLGLCLIKF